MRNLYWKLIGLAMVGVAGVYFHVYVNAGFVFHPQVGVSYRYMVLRDGLLYAHPVTRVAGYLVLAALTLLVLFADRLEAPR